LFVLFIEHKKFLNKKPVWCAQTGFKIWFLQTYH